jgi:hypothetical protein
VAKTKFTSTASVVVAAAAAVERVDGNDQHRPSFAGRTFADRRRISQLGPTRLGDGEFGNEIGQQYSGQVQTL